MFMKTQTKPFQGARTRATSASPSALPERRAKRRRNRWGRVLAGVALGAGLALSGPGRADTHTVPVTLGSPADWTVTARVEGQDARFIQEGDEGTPESGQRLILYTAPKQVTLSVYADFHGQLPDRVEPTGLTLEITSGAAEWTIEGGVATTVVDLTTNQQVLAIHRLIIGRVTLETTDPLWRPVALFSATLYVGRPLSVSAGGALGGSLAVYSWAHQPVLKTNAAGGTWLDYQFDPLPGAAVKVEPVQGVAGAGGWVTTDESGRALVPLWAETSSPVDAAGFIQASVRLKAVKDRATVQREVALHIPYALVEGVNGGFLVGSAGGIMEPSPLLPGQNLLPGDVVQVGSEAIGSGVYLTVRFCNGQRVTLQSDTFGGVRAVVGQGSLDHRTPLLQAAVQNLAQDLRADPRRFGRMLVYKALGNALDGFLGIPDPVGWKVTTPGGAVENWLADFVESAYQPRAQRSLAGGPGPAAGDLRAADAPWVAGVVDFYNDGTARAYNRGATVRLEGPSGAASVPRQGMVVARFNSPANALSPVGVAPSATASAGLITEPAPGAADVPVRPRLRVRLAEASDAIVPGGLSSRLDGRLVSFQDHGVEGWVYPFPPDTALAPGPHQWELELALAGGGILRTSLVFRVSDQLPAPRAVRAQAGRQRVALRWDAEALAWARGGFVVYRRAPGGTAERISGPTPLREPNFVDPDPVAGAAYEVAGLDATGREGPRSAPVSVNFPGLAPAAPGPVAVTWATLEPDGRPALAIEDLTPGLTLWRIEVAASPDGPFADLLSGELTTRTPWPVPEPYTESRRWFRVTPVNADGLEGPPTLLGPVPLPAPLPAVTGLTASLEASGAIALRWDPWTARAPVGYRVESRTNDTWVARATVDAAAPAWTDPVPPRGEARQWRVVARLADGSESPPSVPVLLRALVPPAVPGVVRFETATLTGAEGATLDVPLVREGALDLPAFVTWSSWDWSGTAGPDVDYTAGGGLLVFAPGETRKVISIPLLPDAMRERPDEFFYVHLRSVEGGLVPGDPARMQVFITDGFELAWENIWLYAPEDGPAEQVFRVNLSGPATHAVSVDYAFVPEASTATPGEDFTGPLNGTLSFAPGQTSAWFTVTLINDTLKEGTRPEEVKYRLQNPQGAAIDDTDPFRRYATLQIADDDTRPGQAVFDITTLRLREGQSRTLRLRREGGSDGALEVFLFPLGGTAEVNSDWSLDPPQPRFAEGQTALDVTFNARADGQAEGAEVVVLGLHGGFGPGQMQTLLVVIEDAESPASGFATWAAQQLDQFPAAARAADADADGDGLPNWIEYLWRTDPARPDRVAKPEQSFSEWGEWQVRVTVRDDPATVVLAEFARDALWSSSSFDAGTWQANGDGTRSGTFRFYNFGGQAGFVRFRCEWLGAP
jgi:hypothetical protein